MAIPAPRKLTSAQKQQLKDPKFALALRAVKSLHTNKPPKR